MILNKTNLSEFHTFLELCQSEGGVILINKDLNWTSFDVVAKLRKITNFKKIGHAGTLDPLASGLLIICLGKATKSIESFQNQTKEYLAEIKFGAKTVSFDREFEEYDIQNVDFTLKDLEHSISKFIGNIEQIPPNYSAKKINGKRSYQLARKDIDFKLKPSLVTIHNIELLDYKDEIAKLRIVCSKGTYIRAIARDLGNDLKCGAYLYSLERTRIGEFFVNDALRISDLVI